MPAYFPLLLLAGALLVFYLVARDISRAVKPALGGLGLIAPLAGIVVVAALLGQTDVALGAALSGAVASLGLAGGLSLLQGRGTEPAGGQNMSWALLVPAALAVFMVGMSGFVGWVAAGALAVLGVAILPALTSALAPAAGVAVAVVPVGAPSSVRWWVLGLGVLLALLAGWAAVEGVTLLATQGHRPPAALLAATVLGPAAVMPLLSLATTRARDGEPMRALGMCVSFSATAALILPVIAAIVTAGVEMFRTREAVRVLMPFPATLWRVECVLLLVLSVLMVPLAAGRFTPTKRDGGILLGLYVVYLVFSTVAGLRIG